MPNDEFVYADALVICGPLGLRPGTTDVVPNPSVEASVLSKSTEAHDRGDKQKGYLALPSIQHLVLISQRERRVEVYTRQINESFRFDVVEQGDRPPRGVGITLAVDELYAGVLELPGD